MNAPFSKIPNASPDPIFAIAQKAREAGPEAIDASVGVIIDDEGKPVVLESIRLAAALYAESLSKSDFNYPPLSGIPGYLDAITNLVLGNSDEPYARIATTGGTGANATNLRLKKALGYENIILPTPTWANHHQLINGSGLCVTEVNYLIDETPSIDAIISALNSDQPSAIYLQAGCHNPTGLDLSEDDWNKLAEALTDSPHCVLLDFAYQGFGKGIEEDAKPIQILKNASIPTLISWSASKNHCLYGLRTGAAFAITNNSDDIPMINRHYSMISRQLYSAAPTSGQLIVEILHNKFADQWRMELDELRSILRSRRESLKSKLPDDFQQSLDGHGLYARLPLSEEQILELQKRNVFMTMDGRINIAGVPTGRIGELGEKINSVI
ncbi:aminotransferase class I/II-fold pyridoxal phosphate-dependent enzyme [Patescibacteria group bacterium]|nr:aminotransferase class I/II-fold pyridoxal phosphate-dependent enzyme [Patescibacteria group bacterium]